MPSQDPSDTWLEHLCVHEFRHVVQIDKVNQGLTKILYYLFGEQITIAITGIATEKALTPETMLITECDFFEKR